jgi:FkbM family methyltransferase
MAVPDDADSLGFVMGTFESQTCEFIERSIEEGMTVVDAGANIGFYSLLAARRVGPTGKVYAFEPEAANFALLMKNIGLNGYKNIRALPAALAESTKRVALYLSREGSGSHSIYHDAAVGNGSVEVEALSFDEFWEAEGRPAIGFIKMDIEGAEAAALEGMKNFLEATDRLTLITEFFPGALRAAGTEQCPICADFPRSDFRHNFSWATGSCRSIPRTCLRSTGGSASSTGSICFARRHRLAAKERAFDFDGSGSASL